ncbi:hypothetical protein ABG768_017721 [Culter alburnus]|uniref:Uncharacterized protein n=1 Tax=Culter alburnus TaxID=194366 RepID=A0AAW1YST6_CULAL
MTMASVKKLLHDTLDKLIKEDLKRFKSYLKEDGPVPAGKLEKADVTDIAEIMMERFKAEGAVEITLNILRKMDQNQLAEELQNNYTEVQKSSEPAKKRTRKQVQKSSEPAEKRTRKQVQKSSEPAKKRTRKQVQKSSEPAKKRTRKQGKSGQDVESMAHRRPMESEFVEKHRADLIQRVSSGMAIADGLRAKRMIPDEMYSKVHAAGTRQEKIRLLFDVLDSQGSSVKAEFYRLLEKNESYLVHDLEPGPSVQQ